MKFCYLSYYSQSILGIYMINRDYTKERWNIEQPWIDDYETEGNLNVTENQKLKFCREMKTLTNDFKNSTGDQRAATAYKLATYCTQASRWGNCWYLTEYEWSVYGERTKAQKTYENKALDYFDEAIKSSVDSLKYNSMYAKVWLLWRDYQYYYDYPPESQNITPKMNTAMADLKKYWDGVYGEDEWQFGCDCIMDYVRTH